MMADSSIESVIDQEIDQLTALLCITHLLLLLPFGIF